MSLLLIYFIYTIRNEYNRASTSWDMLLSFFNTACLILTHFSSQQDYGLRLHYLSIVIVAALSFYHIVQHWYWVFKRTKSQKAIESHLSNHHIFVPSLEASFMPSSHKRWNSRVILKQIAISKRFALDIFLITWQTARKERSRSSIHFLRYGDFT